MIRVAVIAESARLRGELGGIVRQGNDFELVESVATLEEFELLGAERIDAVDVVVIDAPRWPEELTAAVVLLSDDAEFEASLHTTAGAALLPLTASNEQIAAAIAAVALGLVVFHPDHMDRAGPLAPSPVDDPLTPREHEVLQRLAAGLGNKAIASRLGISEHTAKFHVAQILAKLNAATRGEAVSIAMRRGLVPM